MRSSSPGEGARGKKYRGKGGLDSRRKRGIKSFLRIGVFYGLRGKEKKKITKVRKTGKSQSVEVWGMAWGRSS